EEQDGRRVREEEAALLRQGEARVRVEALVRVRDAASEREPARDRPHDEEQEEDDEREANAAAPADVPPRFRRAGAAVVDARPVARGAAGPRRCLLRPPLPPLQRDVALRAATAVDAVGLLFARHPAG